MRFARVGEPGCERPVVVVGDRLRDLSPVTEDLDGAFLSRLATGDLVAMTPDELPDLGPAGTPRWAPPVPRPGKVVGIGLNYRCHAAEVGSPVPSEPVVFLKASTSVCGAQDDIVLLPGSTTTDYEVELGVVVGRELRRVTPDDALAAVAGYVLAHDVSDRTMQLERGGTWTKGKSADTFCPLGPWLVTRDELGDPSGVRLRLEVNGTRRQDGTTADLVFGVAEVLAYLSGLMTLEPGDVVVTGTPAGVAMARPDERSYLRAGDVVVADGGILGWQRNRVVDPSLVTSSPVATAAGR